MTSRPPARPLLRLATIASAIVALACGNNDDLAARRDSVLAASESAYVASHRATMPPDTTDSASTAPAELTDGNIIALLAQSDRMEVQAARLAMSKATGPVLRAFARELADNHSAEEADARKLAQRLKITETPAPGDSTKARQEALIARLTALPKGTGFDTMYVRHLVDGHAAMLKDAKAIEGKASNAEVKKLVQASIPELERHRARARTILRLLTPAPKTPAAKK